MLLGFIAARGLPFVLLLAGESYVLKNHGETVPLSLGEASTLSVPRAYGLVLLTNLVASTVVVAGTLSLRVSKARKEYDVPLPELYATGKDEKAKKFNCVQRGHQQALETFPSFLGFSLIGGLRHPIVTSLLGVLYCASRLAFADGYALDPEKRYTHNPLGKHVYTALIGTMAATVSTAAGIMGLF